VCPTEGPPGERAARSPPQPPAEVCRAVPAIGSGGRTEGEPPPGVTTRPTLDTYRPPPLDTGRCGASAPAAPATAAEPAPAASSSAETAPSQAAQRPVGTAKTQVDKAYEYGAPGPDSYDCSGLTQTATGRGASNCRTPAGVSPRWARGSHGPTCGRVTWCSFYEPVSHVGIYVGDGQMVDAGSEETGVSQRTVEWRATTSPAGSPDPVRPPRPPAQRRAGRSGGTFRTPKTSRSATRAALSPH
jgi:cell wall-associated NlpC family hydrolase